MSDYIDWGTVPEWINLFLGFLGFLSQYILIRQGGKRKVFSRISTIIPNGSPLGRFIQNLEGAIVSGLISGLIVGVVFGGLIALIALEIGYQPILSSYPSPIKGRWNGGVVGSLSGIVGGFTAWLITRNSIRMGAWAAILGLLTTMATQTLSFYTSPQGINLENYMSLAIGVAIATWLLKSKY